MARKKWSPKSDLTADLIRFREKRKWQIALRRYVLERNPAIHYAQYFGLDIATMRNWFENQFENEIGWADFGTKWQFDHIVPVTYFDFSSEGDLKMCWNFTNLSVGVSDPAKNRGNRVDILGAKVYFKELFEKTGYEKCRDLLQKIEAIETAEMINSARQQDFILRKGAFLKQIESYSAFEFELLNKGLKPEAIQAQTDFLKKYNK